MMHELKTWTEYFEEVWAGNKQFEVRINDRNFQKGDAVILWEVDRLDMIRTGRYIKATISYVLKDDKNQGIGLERGYCIFGLKKAKRYSANKGEYYAGLISF